MPQESFLIPDRLIFISDKHSRNTNGPVQMCVLCGIVEDRRTCGQFKIKTSSFLSSHPRTIFHLLKGQARPGAQIVGAIKVFSPSPLSVLLSNPQLTVAIYLAGIVSGLRAASSLVLVFPPIV